MVTLLEEDKRDFFVRIDELHSLEEAGIPDAELVRRPLNKEHLESLILSDPRSWPAVLVIRTDIGYVLLDGYHLRAAAKAKGLDKIKATSKTFQSEVDVIEAAFEANLHHSLKVNTQGRCRYADFLHVTSPNMLINEIAREAGITEATVSIAIERREEAYARAKRNGATDEEAYQQAEKMREQEDKQAFIRKRDIIRKGMVAFARQPPTHMMLDTYC